MGEREHLRSTSCWVDTRYIEPAGSDRTVRPKLNSCLLFSGCALRFGRRKYVGVLRDEVLKQSVSGELIETGPKLDLFEVLDNLFGRRFGRLKILEQSPGELPTVVGEVARRYIKQLGFHKPNISKRRFAPLVIDIRGRASNLVVLLYRDDGFTNGRPSIHVRPPRSDSRRAYLSSHQLRQRLTLPSGLIR